MIERLFIGLGSSGNGSLFVDNGGQPTNRESFIGNSAGSNGFVSFSGAGSQWNNAEFLNVGVSGGGTLNVLNGGVVNNFVGDVGGNLIGNYSGLGERALVGHFGGTDLFITYVAGGGNGSLF